jgi:hypothetical protein
MEEARIVEICDLAVAPEWTKAILIEAIRLQG